MTKIDKHYDVIILENGSAGQACALRCAELGLKTLLINTGNLNQSSKPYSTQLENLSVIALLESAKLYESITNSSQHGIYAENVVINFSEMVARKDSILSDVHKSLQNALKNHGIHSVNGSAQILSPGIVSISLGELKGLTHINATHIVLATDSLPISLPCAPIDNQFILDSTTALNFTHIPKSIAVLGAGIVGLQIAGIWNRLGAKVIILEAQETFLNVTDFHISSMSYQIFLNQGLEILLGTRVISTKVLNKKVIVEYQDMDGTHAIKVDQLIVASGRKPNSEGLSAPEADLLIDEDGFIPTNDQYRTNLPGVYALGDLTMHGPMLSHKGIAEGQLLAEQIFGNTAGTINYRTIPNVIYTEPEIAWVGQTEQSLKAMGESINTAIYHLEHNLRAKAFGKTAGIVKIITHAKTDEILGVHALTTHASEIISEAALGIEFSASKDDLTRAIHSHPSLNEAIFEVGISIK